MLTRFTNFDLGPAEGQVMLSDGELVDVKFDGIEVDDTEVGIEKGYGRSDAVLISLTMAGVNMPIDLNLTPEEAITIANEIIRRAESIKQKEGGGK